MYIMKHATKRPTCYIRGISRSQVTMYIMKHPIKDKHVMLEVSLGHKSSIYL